MYWKTCCQVGTMEGQRPCLEGDFDLWIVRMLVGTPLPPPHVTWYVSLEGLGLASKAPRSQSPTHLTGHHFSSLPLSEWESGHVPGWERGWGKSSFSISYHGLFLAAKMMRWQKADQWLLEKCIGGVRGMWRFYTYLKGSAGGFLELFLGPLQVLNSFQDTLEQFYCCY